MEIKILHHPNQEAVARRIGELLTTNGISSQLSDTADAPNGVHISVNQKTDQKSSATENQSFLTSSFVDVDSTPGY